MIARMNPASRLLAVAALLLLAAGPVRAQVATSLSSQTGQVGVPLQLQYQFSNVGKPADMPRSIMVDGLEIRLTGTSRRVEMVNLQTTSMFIFAYTVMPNRPGNFTVPGFAVQVDGRQVRTQAVSLRVAGSGGSRRPRGCGAMSMTSTSKPPASRSLANFTAFAEVTRPGGGGISDARFPVEVLRLSATAVVMTMSRMIDADSERGTWDGRVASL